jgi:branched-chain amino acid transport system permease protein
MMLILGGMGTLLGAVLGAFSYVLLQEWFSALTKHWQLLMGVFIVAAVLLLPQGLIGLHQLRLKPRLPRAEDDSD